MGTLRIGICYEIRGTQILKVWKSVVLFVEMRYKNTIVLSMSAYDIHDTARCLPDGG